MSYRKLGTSSKDELRALLVNLVKEIIIKEKIVTTKERAKEARKFVDKLITRAKKNTVPAKRDVISFLMNDKKVANKIFTDLVLRYENRHSGYTRILKLEERRGDHADMVIIELVK